MMPPILNSYPLILDTPRTNDAEKYRIVDTP